MLSVKKGFTQKFLQFAKMKKCIVFSHVLAKLKKKKRGTSARSHFDLKKNNQN